MSAEETGVPVAFTDREVSALVDAINVRHATSFVLLHRYGSGDGTGAYRLEGADGRTYVLKCVRGNDTAAVERAETATTFLRGRGYPAPEYVAVGSVEGAVYEVQTALPGRHIGSIGPRVHYLEQALALNDLQEDGPELGGPPWPAPVVDPVLHGGNWGTTMSSHSPATASLLAELQELVETNLAGVPTDRHDIVHFDFHADNILATRERITGVIDWQPVTGDRTFDLMQLAYGEGACGVVDCAAGVDREIGGGRCAGLRRVPDTQLRGVGDAPLPAPGRVRDRACASTPRRGRGNCWRLTRTGPPLVVLRGTSGLTVAVRHDVVVTVGFARTLSRLRSPAEGVGWSPPVIGCIDCDGNGHSSKHHGPNGRVTAQRNRRSRPVTST